MIKPAFILALEKKLKIPLHPAPKHGHDPLRNVMACRRDPKRESGWLSQYTLHLDGSLAGLNLAGLGLEKWDASDFPEVDFSRMEALNLGDNALTQFDGLGEMTHLRYLDLSKNRLEVFELPAGVEGLEHLWLYENPDMTSPAPNIVQQGRHAIVQYFRELGEGEETVFEAKVLILGDPAAGKTTLAWKIENPKSDMPKEEVDTTRGIAVRTLPLKQDEPIFTAHIWDFGGQEIYHATHQFFLTQKSLYILVCNGRKEDPLDYWLQMQEIYGRDSALMIVVNQKGTIQPSLPIGDLRREYPNIKEDPILVNLATDEPGTLQLRQKIERTIRRLPHFERGERVPKKWVMIRKALEKIKDDHIPITQFRSICTTNGIAEKERQDFLLSFLHDIGVFLHFKDVAGLKQMLILRPEWVTNAVYKVLDHTKDKKEHGHFTKQDLDKIWNCAEYESYFEELLLLLEKFDLCYPAPEKKGLYIIPSLLPDEPPKGYTWKEPTVLLLNYQYTFMPKGIMARLVVRLHILLEYEPIMWKRGGVFAKNGVRIEVIERHRDNRISLCANSNSRQAKELLTIICHEIDTLNKGFHFNDRIKVEQIIPCNCLTCKDLPKPHEFTRAELDHCESHDQKVYCLKSFTLIPPRQVLDGIFASDHLKREITPKEALVKMVEEGELKEALQILKNEGEEVSSLLARLNIATQANADNRTDFKDLSQTMAQITHAILDIIHQRT